MSARVSPVLYIMDSHKSKKTEDKAAPKRLFVPVKSRYMGSTKKGSSLSLTNSDTPNENILGISAPKSEKNVKASTPNKDISKLLPVPADLSVVFPDHGAAKPTCEDSSDEGLADIIFEEYNKALVFQALGVLIDEHQTQFAETADKQLAILQKAVEDSESALSNLDLKVHATTSVADLHEDVATLEEMHGLVVDDPALTDSKSFEDVTQELEDLLGQLPCKNVKIPTNKADLDEIEIAARKLSDALSRLAHCHGEEITKVASVKEEMEKIDTFCTDLKEANSNLRELIPVATTKVLDETSRKMMNSTVANLEIKF